MDQIFLDPEPKLVDVGAGSINCTCLELEPWPGILVPVPQPWFPLPLICELKMVAANEKSVFEVRCGQGILQHRGARKGFAAFPLYKNKLWFLSVHGSSYGFDFQSVGDDPRYKCVV